jgi:hypothetical protein
MTESEPIIAGTLIRNGKVRADEIAVVVEEGWKEIERYLYHLFPLGDVDELCKD